MFHAASDHDAPAPLDKGRASASGCWSMLPAAYVGAQGSSGFGTAFVKGLNNSNAMLGTILTRPERGHLMRWSWDQKPRDGERAFV